MWDGSGDLDPEPLLLGCLLGVEVAVGFDLVRQIVLFNAARVTRGPTWTLGIRADGLFEFPQIGPATECPDINGDGEVNVDEVLSIISGWGSSGHEADANDDDVVDADDLLYVLANWGSC